MEGECGEEFTVEEGMALHNPRILNTHSNAIAGDLDLCARDEADAAEDVEELPG